MHVGRIIWKKKSTETSKYLKPHKKPIILVILKPYFKDERNNKNIYNEIKIDQKKREYKRIVTKRLQIANCT